MYFLLSCRLRKYWGKMNCKRLKLPLRLVRISPMGHLKAVHHLLAYLNKNVTNRGFYLTSLTLFLLYILTIDQTCDLQLEEELLLKIPEPLGTPVTLRGAFVVANHAGIVLVMRRSHTGIMLFVQNSPMQWLSKRQNTV